jgi:hypothetical protein
MASFKTKQDLLNYLNYFNKDDFDNFPSYFTPNVTMDLNGVIKTEGRPALVDFIRAQRDHMLENIKLHESFFAKGAVTIRATITFTPLHDITEVRYFWLTIILLSKIS